MTIGVVPRMPMVATGVSIRMLPVGAIWPVTKMKVPWSRLSSREFDDPSGS